ncbi:MAG: hypothetical protein RL142_985 [Actinomycetota bacterium]|jgi:hypothetical protein
MGAHVSSPQYTKTVFRSGMFIRVKPIGLEIHFGPLAKAWPLVWKRATLAGMTPEVLTLKRPTLLIHAELHSFLELLKPRAQKQKSRWPKQVSLLAGVAVIVISFIFPIKATQTKTTHQPTVKADTCALARLKQVVSGDTEAPDIEFNKAESFGGITSGVLTCKGVRYKYTLESKGLERVLKVGKLDS